MEVGGEEGGVVVGGLEKSFLGGVGGGVVDGE